MRSGMRLLARSGILDVVALDEYQESALAVQRVKAFAIANREEIWRLLGLSCNEGDTGIQIVNKLAKRLGYKAEIVRRVGERGAQKKLWKLNRFSH